MKNLLVLILVLALTGCSCICPAKPFRVISNEKNTNIYLNDEFQGADSTFVIVKNRHVDKVRLRGEKKGCPTKEIPIEHYFDIGVFWILDLRNIVRLLTWDVYLVDDSKDFYNVTPKCD